MTIFSIKNIFVATVLYSLPCTVYGQDAIAMTANYRLDNTTNSSKTKTSETPNTSNRFVPNTSNTNQKDLFSTQIDNFQVTFDKNSFVVLQVDSSKKNTPKTWIWAFDGINEKNVLIEGNKPMRSKVYYNESPQNAFDEVWYKKLHEGTNLRFFLDKDGNLKYNYILQPLQEVNAIKFHIADAKSYFLDKTGNLNFATKKAKVTQAPPIAYQIIDFQEVNVACKYILNDQKIGFATAEYNKEFPLIIEGTVINRNTKTNEEALSLQYRWKVWSKQHLGALSSAVKNPVALYKTSSTRTLHANEQELLKAIIRTSPDYQKRLQAQAIAMYYKGFWSDRIADALDIDKKLVMEWVLQWQRSGTDSLK